MSDEYLTISELEKKYPNQWVLLGRPKVDPKTLEVFGGHVIFTAPTRAEFDQRLVDAEPVNPGAIHYTGRPAPDTVFAFHA
jgi:hypothetical protein